MRVFEGGEGCTSGGRSERSRDSGDLERDDALERWGDGISAGMVAVFTRVCCTLCCTLCLHLGKLQKRGAVIVGLMCRVRCGGYSANVGPLSSASRQAKSRSDAPAGGSARVPYLHCRLSSLLPHSGHSGICTAPAWSFNRLVPRAGLELISPWRTSQAV